MLKQGSKISIGVAYGRPLLGCPGSSTTVRSWGMLASQARQGPGGLTTPSSAYCKKIIHSGLRFMQSSNKVQVDKALRFQTRSYHPNNAPKKNHVCSRLRNNDHKNDLKLSLLNAVFRPSPNATTADRFKDVMFCMKRFISWQFDSQARHRLQKTLRYYSKYSKIWKDQSGALRILNTLRRMLLTRGHFLVSAVGVYSYDWENNKISDDAMKRGARDLDILGELFKKTIICQKCGERQVIDQKIASIVYCMCDGKLGYIDKSRTYDGWEPFIERDNVIVWRKPHEVHTHLFYFKVYGRYEDVSLSAFMESQLNTHYRTEWDFTALQLRILHSHNDSNSDLLYWLVKFPSFFSNRDYLFKRRFDVDPKSQVVTILNEALESSEVLPESRGVVRVSEYWSNTVIRPLQGKSKPGIEYSLTYFDNPGTRLPQSVSNFIASTGFPNFLKQNHLAALTLQSRYENGEDVYESLPYSLRYPHILEESDLKTCEEQLPIEDEGHVAFTLGKVDQVPESTALQNLLENDTERKERTQENNTESIETSHDAALPEIDHKETSIQFEIVDKSDILQKESSHLATTEENNVLRIEDMNKLTKEESIFEEKDVAIIPSENVTMQEEELTKEEFFDKDMNVITDNLKEKEIISESVEMGSFSKDALETLEFGISNDLVSENIVENITDLDVSTHTTLSKPIVENITDLDISSQSTAPKPIRDDFEVETASVESNEYSQNDKILPLVDEKPSIPDTKVEVLMGSKKVIVDLLEAMEVISPELEEKTVLLQKVEDWAESALKDIDENTEFVQNVKRLRKKIEKFKERAKNKKMQSLRIMEEMEKQTYNEKELKPRKEFGHYDHSGGQDEKTMLIMEKFLITMKDILEKDRDIRTGRGYNTGSSENLENNLVHIFRKRMPEDKTQEINLNILRDSQYPSETLKHKVEESTVEKIEDKQKQIENKYDCKIRVDEIEVDNINEDVKNESKSENEDDDPPKDPPAPIGSKPVKNTKRVKVDNITSTETNLLNKNVKSEMVSERESQVVSSTNGTWIYRYVPGMALFGGGNKVPDHGSDSTMNDTTEDHSSHNVNSKSSSWYMLGLDGYFNKTEVAQETESDNTNGCDNVESNSTTAWYWYPIVGVHKLYSWAWNATGVKA